ncbi:hypothetical protein [Microseira wollei]|uniref:hypothetical protein n=1 Tax=Microseira wollei TaxID=467598 RepID=UPI001CFD0725|nr:hypothetical protein [Microseira wollei]
MSPKTNLQKYSQWGKKNSNYDTGEIHVILLFCLESAIAASMIDFAKRERESEREQEKDSQIILGTFN